MAKRDRTLEALDKLAAATKDPRTPSARVALVKALGSRSNLVIAAALELIHANELAGFEDTMKTTFERAMTNPLRSDPGCRTKVGVVKALDTLGEPADALFLAGVRHVQPEPVWGGTQDSAVALRGMCAMALVNCRHADAMIELARLLADPEREARRAAADALAVSGDTHAGVPLLMLRICAKDPEPEVLSACFAGLLSLDASQTFDFVASHLRSRDDSIAEAAALALSQERPPGALAALREFAERSLGEQRELALLSISMLRSEDAWSYLLTRVTHDTLAVAREAIAALAVYREHPGLAQRVRAAIERREGDGDRLGDDLAESFE